MANDDAATTDEDQPVVVAVLTNDTDPDGDLLAVQSVTQGAKGVVSFNANGTVTYAPNANTFGNDSFNYTVSDGRGGTATAVVLITVKPVNDPPLAGSDSATTDQNKPVTISVLANDTDVDGDLMTVAGVTQGAGGMVVIGAGGTVTPTCTATANGSRGRSSRRGSALRSRKVSRPDCPPCTAFRNAPSRSIPQRF